MRCMLQPNFSPFPQITTDRLLLTPVQQKDAVELLKLRSSEIVMQFIDKERTKNLEEASALIKRIEEDAINSDGITWKISVKKEPEKLIGTIGFWRIIKPHYRAEVGYMLHPDFWNNGFMKEALQAVIDFGFNNIRLHSIEAHINPSNTASAKLLEAVGFVREAYFKEDYFFRDRFLDSAIYSLLNNK
jgi:[ribosomal protein S5]-alanine N-acetyltransferase